MLTIDQCKTYAAEYKKMGNDPDISARKSSVLGNISHSLTALANQLDSLYAILRDEAT